MVIRVLNYGKVALNYENGLARVKTRVEVSWDRFGKRLSR